MASLPPSTQPNSVAHVYALEAEYKAVEAEYKALMERLNHTCVGKAKAAEECVKAAQMNANMQTTLSKMSDALEITKLPKKNAQQQKLLLLSDKLDEEYVKLTAKNKDEMVKTTMFKTHYLAWALGAGLLVMLAWRVRR